MRNFTSIFLLLALPCLLFTQESTLLDVAVLNKSDYKVIDSLRMDAYYNGRYKDALYYNRFFVRKITETFGKKSEEYIQARRDLAITFEYVGINDSAELVYKEVILESKDLLGPTHLEYANSLNTLGSFYIWEGSHKEAEELLMEAARIYEETVGEAHSDALYNYVTLSDLYLRIGSYRKAIECSEKINTIIRGQAELEATFLSTNLNNISIAYQNLGELEKALGPMLEAMELEKKRSRETLEYGQRLNNLALLYKDMGRLEAATPLMLESLDLSLKLLGENHIETIYRYNNIARIYLVNGDLEKSLKYYLKATEGTKKTVGENHHQYAERMNNLGLLYLKMRDHEKALSCFNKAYDVSISTLGKESDLFANTQLNLARVNYEMSEFDQALTYAKTSREAFKNSLGDRNSKYEAVLFLMANIYEKMGAIEKAATAFKKAQEDYDQRIATTFDQFSEIEQASLMNSDYYRNKTDQLYSFLIRHQRPEIVETAYNHSLLFKGLMLGNRKSLMEAVKNQEGDKVGQLFDDWKKELKKLYRQYRLPLKKRMDNLDSLESKVNTLESSLARASSKFKKARARINWKEVQQELKEDEVAIEFVSFQYFDAENEAKDSAYYLAYLIEKEANYPEVVFLFEEKNLGNLEATRNLYRFNPDNPNSLYQLVWKPLEPFIKDAQTIYYSPSGLLHRINLGAIPYDSKITLSEKFKMVNLGSTRQLAQEQEEIQYNKSAMVLGGIEYDFRQEDSVEIAGANLHQLAERNLPDSLRAYQPGGWNYLDWTLVEAEEINAILKNNDFKTQLITGEEGLESTVIQAFRPEQSNSLIHLATHGYFFPKPKRDAQTGFSSSEHPLMRSGLILTGANHVWKGGEPDTKLGDGILTAYEIAQLDLSQTELVVLSACNTGLGDIKDNEGVYGLQRALKTAGVKYILMSLWNVKDRQTKEFMTTFYEAWLEKKKTIPDAYQSAQQELRERYAKPFNPSLWAGFILVN